MGILNERPDELIRHIGHRLDAVEAMGDDLLLWAHQRADKADARGRPASKSKRKH